MLKEKSTDEARRLYHQSLRACRTHIRQRKGDYEKLIAREAKSNPKKFFIYITTKKKTKINIDPLKDERDVLTQDSRQMVEILNKNFASLFTVENTQSVPEGPAPPMGITSLQIGSKSSSHSLTSII